MFFNNIVWKITFSDVSKTFATFEILRFNVLIGRCWAPSGKN